MPKVERSEANRRPNEVGVPGVHKMVVERSEGFRAGLGLPIVEGETELVMLKHFEGKTGQGKIEALPASQCTAVINTVEEKY